MSEKFFPFDSVNGDRSYLAKDFRKYFKAIITSGIFAGGNNLPVTSAGGLNITVGLGFAWVEGALYEVEGTPLPFAIAPGGANPRIDRVIVRLDIAARKVYSTVVQGTPAASPVAPALVRNDDFYDLGLAEITVPASAISITNSAIVDTRANSAICGIVRSPVESITIDDFMENCQVSFDEWFSNIKAQFAGNVAGNLQEQITTVKTDLANGVYATKAVLHLHTVPGAAVTLTLGGITLSATANSQGVADFYPYKLGAWSIIASTSNGTYTGTIDIASVSIIDIAFPTIQAMKWADISAVGAAGVAPYTFRKGDQKTVTLTTGEVITLRLEDFAHDDLATGSGKAPFSFMMLDLLADTEKMNTTGTNVGGWESSAMRSNMATLLTKIPADLRAVIRPVKKKTTSGNKATTIKTTTEHLWIASAKEVNAWTGTGYNDEGETYPLFVDEESRIKKLSDGAGSANGWWTRSPSTSNATSFIYIYPSGGSNSATATFSYGVCVGLCV